MTPSGPADDGSAAGGERGTLRQRMALRKLRRLARTGRGEPPTSADRRATWQLASTPTARAMKRVWRTLPSSARCGMCSAPFAGPGRLVTRPLGYRPSSKTPTLCATCVELSPPGGMKMLTGLLSADLRGSTRRSGAGDAEKVAGVLRRFYGCAESVLFPEAVIDEFIGDEVTALCLPDVQRPDHPRAGAHAHAGARPRSCCGRSATGHRSARFRAGRRRSVGQLGTSLELELKGKAQPDRAYRVTPVPSA